MILPLPALARALALGAALLDEGAPIDPVLWDLARPLDPSVGETRLWSSFDRSGGNDDGFTGRFGDLGESDGRTLVDASGPGALVRIWSADPTDAPIEFWYDDEVAPRRVVPFRELFEEVTSGGHVASPDLRFAHRLRLVARGPVRFYQFVTVEGPEPDGARAPEFPGRGAARDLEPRKTWIGAGGAPILTFAPLRFPLRLEPSQALRAEVPGAGAVTRLEVVVAGDGEPSVDDALLRRAVLTVYVDGEATPRVEAPLADFFAVGPRAVPLECAPFSHERGAAGSRLVSRFVLPFADGLRVDLTARGGVPLRADVRLHGVRSETDPFAGWRFCARFRTTLSAAGEFVPLLRAEGRGCVVGVSLVARGPRGLSFLEGDEQALVDGRGPERYHGTGTEDFFDCAWYFSGGEMQRPFHGLTWKGADGVAAYRFLVRDPIPFREEVEFRIEHGGRNDEPGVEYGVVTYWYADRQATHDFGPMPPWACAPPRRVVGYDRPALHVREMEPISRFESLPLERLSDSLGGPRYVVVEGRTPAAALRYVVDVPDRYRLFALHAREPSGGAATISTSGVDRVRVDAVSESFVPIAETALGEARLDRGRHELLIAHDGGGRVLVEGLRLEPSLPFVRRYAVRGPWPFGERGEGFDVPLDRDEPWREVLASEDGFLPLGAHVAPNQYVVADARVVLESPDARTVTLRLGSDDWLRVFVNGDPVHRNRVHRAPRPDQDLVPVTLRAGRNEIVLRVANEDGGYGLFCRISDPEGGLRVQ